MAVPNDYQYGIDNTRQFGVDNVRQWTSGAAAAILLSIVGYWITKPGNQYFATDSTCMYHLTKDSNQRFITNSR